MEPLVSLCLRRFTFMHSLPNLVATFRGAFGCLLGLIVSFLKFRRRTH